MIAFILLVIDIQSNLILNEDVHITLVHNKYHLALYKDQRVVLAPSKITDITDFVIDTAKISEDGIYHKIKINEHYICNDGHNGVQVCLKRPKHPYQITIHKIGHCTHLINDQGKCLAMSSPIHLKNHSIIHGVVFKDCENAISQCFNFERINPHSNKDVPTVININVLTHIEDASHESEIDHESEIYHESEIDNIHDQFHPDLDIKEELDLITKEKNIPIKKSTIRNPHKLEYNEEKHKHFERKHLSYQNNLYKKNNIKCHTHDTKQFYRQKAKQCTFNDELISFKPPNIHEGVINYVDFPLAYPSITCPKLKNVIFMPSKHEHRHVWPFHYNPEGFNNKNENFYSNFGQCNPYYTNSIL